MVDDALILDALRTPIGRYRGALAGVRPDDLAALVIRSIVARNGLDPERIDDVFLGCANQAGEDNRNVARMANLLAELPVSVPGTTVNRLCASGLEAVNQAARAIRAGDAELCLAGGVESMTRSPWVLQKQPAGWPRGEQTLHDTTLGWRMINPEFSGGDHTEAMGETGENVAAERGVSRSDQDELALRPRQRAAPARRPLRGRRALRRRRPGRRDDHRERLRRARMSGAERRSIPSRRRAETAGSGGGRL